MACDTTKDQLVARLYGELDDAAAERLDAHLAACSGCRGEFEALGAARGMLRESEPVLPASSRVVLLAPRFTRRPALTFAAGFACALLVLCAGLGAGWTMRDRRDGGDLPPVAAGLSRSEVEALLRDQAAAWETRLAANRQAPESAAAGSVPAALTRADLDSAFSRLERKIDGRRSSDLGYILDAISASELRSNARIGQTREALRYVALASDPRISAQ